MDFTPDFFMAAGIIYPLKSEKASLRQIFSPRGPLSISALPKDAEIHACCREHPCRRP